MWLGGYFRTSADGPWFLRQGWRALDIYVKWRRALIYDTLLGKFNKSKLRLYVEQFISDFWEPGVRIFERARPKKNDSMGFILEHLAITKAILELNPSGGLFRPCKKLPCRRKKFKDDAEVFHEEDKHILSAYYNRPLYVIAFVHDVKLYWGLVELRSLLNIMPLSMLEVVGIPRDQVVKQLIEVSGFGSNASFMLGYSMLT